MLEYTILLFKVRRTPVARLFITLLCTLCVLVTLPAISFSAPDYPLGTIDYSGAGVRLDVSKTSTQLTSISLVSPNIVIQDQVVDFRTFQMIGIPGEPAIMEEGLPTVPHVTRLYRIPNTGGVDLVVREAEFEVVDNVDPLPFQFEGNEFEGLRRNEGIYSANDWFPQEIATMSDPMIWRDFRVVTVTLHPVQVNPVTHQARIYHTLTVDIVANDKAGLNELTNPRRPSMAFVPMYRTMIANLDEFSLDDSTTTPGSYLIISKDHATMNPWVDSLATWKKRQGFDVVVERRTNWTASSIITFVRSAYANWPAPLEFVALMGDPSAAIGVPIDGSQDGGNYDHSYALVPFPVSLEC
jgi:hypothetical protein